MEKRSPWPCFSCPFYEQSNFIFSPTSMMLPGILKKHRLLLFRVLDNHPLPQKTQRDTKKEGTRNCFTFLSRFSESSPQINCKTWSKAKTARTFLKSISTLTEIHSRAHLLSDTKIPNGWASLLSWLADPRGVKSGGDGLVYCVREQQSKLSLLPREKTH